MDARYKLYKTRKFINQVKMKGVQGIQTFKRGVWRFLTCKKVRVDVNIKLSFRRKEIQKAHSKKNGTRKLLNTAQ